MPKNREQQHLNGRNDVPHVTALLCLEPQWNPTSPDRSLLPPLSSYMQLLHPAASRSGCLAAGTFHFYQHSSLTCSASSSQLWLCSRLWRDRRGQTGVVQPAAQEGTPEGAWCSKSLPCQQTRQAEAQDCSQETTVTATLPHLAKKRGVVVSRSCISHLETYLLLTELQIGCHHPVPVPAELASCHWPCSPPALLLQKTPPTTTPCSRLSHGLVLCLRTLYGSSSCVPTAKQMQGPLCSHWDEQNTCPLHFLSAHADPFLHMWNLGCVMKISRMVWLPRREARRQRINLRVTHKYEVLQPN